MAHWEQELDELGKNIQDIVDRAVNSKDFRQLSQTVRQAVDKGSQAVRRVTGVKSRSAAVGAGVKQAPVLYANPKKKQAGAVLKIVGGSLLSVGTLPWVLLFLIRGLLLSVSILSFLTVLLMMGLAGGVTLLLRGIWEAKRLGRFKTYLRTLGGKTYCALEKLAEKTGKSVRFVRRELRQMMQEGLFLQGHLDREETSLITSDETYSHYEQSRRMLEQRQAAQAAEQARQAAQAREQDPSVREVLDRGRAFLTQIRRCNDAIPGERISGKISRMENIVERIFQRVQTNPEVVPDLKKLMDHYLPMTVKLLNAYADMDAQPVQGQNILTSKQEIEDTLDTLNLAFEKLLDDLFQDTALDISSDISVLNTLLAQEGLTEDELTKLQNRKGE